MSEKFKACQDNINNNNNNNNSNKRNKFGKITLFRNSVRKFWCV